MFCLTIGVIYFMRAIVFALLFLSYGLQAHDYKFGAIKGLAEQEVAKVVIPQIYSNIGYEISVTSGPANSIENKLALGFLDGEILRIFDYGEGNENVVRVPTPYYQLETMPFIRTGSGVVVNSIEDLKKYRIGVVKGVKHTQKVTKGHPKVVVLAKTKQLLKLLAKGKIDVVLTNTIDGIINIENLKLDNIEPSEKAIATEPLYHYLYKTNAYLIPKVDNSIKELKASGALNLMIRKAELRISKHNN